MAGERLGALAVRSAALKEGRGVSFGPKGPIVKQGPFVSFIGELPNKISVKGSDSNDPLISVLDPEPLRAKHLNAFGSQLDRLNNVKRSEEPKINTQVLEANGQLEGKILFFPNVTSVKPKTSTTVLVEPLKKITETGIIRRNPNQEKSSLEQLALLSRVRSFLRTRGFSRVQAAPTVTTEAQVSLEPKIAAKSTTDTSVSKKTIVFEAAEKTAPAKSTNKLKAKVQVIDNKNNQNREVRSKKYKAKAEEVNTKRQEVLEKGFEQLKIENPGGEAAGDVLAKRTSIGNDENLKSPIFFQRGELNKVDGSQKRIELMLSSIQAIDKEKLRLIIRGNSAIKETNQLPPELPTSLEVNNVLNPPRQPATLFEPVVIEEIKQEIVKNESQGRDIIYKEAVLPEITEEAQELPEQVIALMPQVLKSNLEIVRAILDSRVDNIIDIEAYKRKELIYNNIDLAA